MLSLPVAEVASYALDEPCILENSISNFSPGDQFADHAYLLSSISTVSIEFSLFHCARHGSLLGST
jgi:hypothetical protein